MDVQKKEKNLTLVNFEIEKETIFFHVLTSWRMHVLKLGPEKWLKTMEELGLIRLDSIDLSEGLYYCDKRKISISDLLLDLSFDEVENIFEAVDRREFKYVNLRFTRNREIAFQLTKLGWNFDDTLERVDELDRIMRLPVKDRYLTYRKSTGETRRTKVKELIYSKMDWNGKLIVNEGWYRNNVRVEYSLKLDKVIPK